ncbi:glycosyltransferase [Pediococcus pentosaceus]|uniref:glycosyltransferase n=1 Tax=Pediococcus pentosaceus TaxID=1255 RepID=UPI0013225B41|nr:glycosyltransferase [Pediococcus pentosaceus]KAF0392811.1 glycosyltransferase [Pediococcus pentosaceus]KAF0433498.1 glycosyltransferase [Pediococcus pentosaceus]KAF0441793.1 glycosyltransferase [Pediococcus pentosaceus]MBF7108510.1 glycosyltransferase [Pediococcus pentosaceus]
MESSKNSLDSYSGLMSVYTREKADRFEKAIESIFAQTVLPSEFILVEDGPLNSELISIIENIEKEFSARKINFIKVCNKVNRGLGYSLNKGLNYANYDLVARFDSDDINRADRLELTLKEFKKDTQLAMVGGNIREFDPKDDAFSKIRKVPQEFENIRKNIAKTNPFNHMTVTFRKKDIQNVGSYEDVPYFEDYYLWFKLIESKRRVINIDKVLVDVCVDNDFIFRRSGFQYLKKEIFFQNLLYSHKYINLAQYMRNILLRGGSRLLPKVLIKLIYSTIRE